MRNLLLKIFSIAFALMMFVSPMLISAQAPGTSTGKCFFADIPGFQWACSNAKNVGNGCLGDRIQGIVYAVAYGFLILVIMIAVIYIIKAALTFVRAEGDEKKVGSAKAAMKNILFGVGAMFICIIGLVLIQQLAAAGTGTTLSEQIDTLLYQLTICPNKPTKAPATPATGGTQNIQ